MGHAFYQACIEACRACAEACDNCAAECRREPSTAHMDDALRSILIAPPFAGLLPNS